MTTSFLQILTSMIGIWALVFGVGFGLFKLIEAEWRFRSKLLAELELTRREIAALRSVVG